jgi:chromosome segregation ATPase
MYRCENCSKEYESYGKYLSHSSKCHKRKGTSVVSSKGSKFRQDDTGSRVSLTTTAPENLKTIIQKLVEKNDKLKQSLTERENQYSSLRQRYTEASEELDKANSRVAELTRESSSLKEKMGESVSEINKKVSERRVLLEKEFELKVSEKVGELSIQINQIKGDLIVEKKSVESLTKSLEDERARYMLLFQEAVNKERLSNERVATLSSELEQTIGSLRSVQKSFDGYKFTVENEKAIVMDRAKENMESIKNEYDSKMAQKDRKIEITTLNYKRMEEQCQILESKIKTIEARNTEQLKNQQTEFNRRVELVEKQFESKYSRLSEEMDSAVRESVRQTQKTNEVALATKDRVITNLEKTVRDHQERIDGYSDRARQSQENATTTREGLLVEIVELKRQLASINRTLSDKEIEMKHVQKQIEVGRSQLQAQSEHEKSIIRKECSDEMNKTLRIVNDKNVELTRMQTRLDEINRLYDLEKIKIVDQVKRESLDEIRRLELLLKSKDNDLTSAYTKMEKIRTDCNSVISDQKRILEGEYIKQITTLQRDIMSKTNEGNILTSLLQQTKLRVVELTNSLSESEIQHKKELGESEQQLNEALRKQAVYIKTIEDAKQSYVKQLNVITKEKESMRKEYEGEVKRFESASKLYERDIEQLNKRVQELKIDASDSLKMATKSLYEENSTLKQHLEESKLAFIRIKENLEHSEKLRKAVESKLQTDTESVRNERLNSRIVEITACLRENEGVIASLNQKIVELTTIDTIGKDATQSYKTMYVSNLLKQEEIMKEQVKKYTELIGKLETDLNESIKSYQGQIEDLQTQIVTKDKCILDLQKQADTINASLDSFRDQRKAIVSELENKIKIAQDALTDSQREAKTLKIQLTQLTTQAENKDKINMRQLEDLKLAHSKELNNNQILNTKKDSTIDELRQTIQNIGRELADSSNLCHRLKTQLNDATETIRQAEIYGDKKVATALQSQELLFSRRDDMLEKSKEIYETRIKTLEDDIKSKTKELQKIGTQYETELNSKITLQEKEYKRLLDEYTKLNKEKEGALETQISVLKHELIKKEAEIGLVRIAIQKELDREISRLEKINNTQMGVINKIEQERVSLSQSVGEIENTTREQLQTEFTSRLKQVIADKNNEIVELKAQFQGQLKVYEDEMRRTIQGINSEADSKVKRIHKELSDMQDQREQYTASMKADSQLQVKIKEKEIQSKLSEIQLLKTLHDNVLVGIKEKHEREIQVHLNTIDRIKADHIAKAVQFETKLKDQEAQLTKMANAQLKDLYNKSVADTDKVKTDYTIALNKQRGIMTAEINNLKTTIDSNKKEKEELLARIKSMQDEHVSVLAKKDDLYIQLKETIQTPLKMKEEILNSQSEELARTRIEYEKYLRETQLAKAKLDTTSISMSMLKNENLSLMTTIAQLREELQTVINRLTQCQNEINILKTKEQTSLEGANYLSRAIDETTTKIAGLEKELMDTKAREKKATDGLTFLSREIDARGVKIDELEQLIKRSSQEKK